MDLTACGCGQVRRSSQSHESQLRTSSQRRIEMKFLIITLSTVQLACPDVCISFILPARGKPDASLWRRRYTVEAKLELSRPQNPLSAPHRRTSTRTQAQLHTPGVEVEMNLQLFFQTARLCFRSQQTTRGRPQLSCAIDDTATGRPRAWKYRDTCREPYGHFAQCSQTHAYSLCSFF